MPRMEPPPPPILHVVADQEAAVREIADQEGLKYIVAEVEGRPGVVQFRFQAMDDDVLISFMSKVPQYAFAYKATVGGALPL